MKKLLFVSLLALCVAVSCQKDAAQEDTVEVNIALSMPTSLQTKAIGDGTTVDKLYYAVYNSDKTEHITSLDGVEPVPVTTVDGKKGWNLTLRLVKNYKYHIFFWAQKEGAPYTFDKTNATVKVDYSGKANDETRDAFCYLATIDVPSDMQNFQPNGGKPFELRRPFAQINFGASDYNMIQELELSVESTISVNGLPDTYSFLTGEISGSATTNLARAAIPYPERLVVNNDATSYGYVGMNYILAPENEYDAEGNVKEVREVNDIDVTFAYNDAFVELEIPNVPYQRNFRTNIIGNFFSVDVKVDVIVVEEFYNPDVVYNYPEDAK